MVGLGPVQCYPDSYPVLARLSANATNEKAAPIAEGRLYQNFSPFHVLAFIVDLVGFILPLSFSPDLLIKIKLLKIGTALNSGPVLVPREPGPDLVPQTPNPDEVGAVISAIDYVVSVGEKEFVITNSL